MVRDSWRKNGVCVCLFLHMLLSGDQNFTDKVRTFLERGDIFAGHTTLKGLRIKSWI